MTGLVLNGLNASTILAGVSALGLRRGQRVLEVGFGGGLSLPLLLRAIGAGGQVFATETSAPMLGRAKRRFIVQRLQGRLRLEQAFVEALPLGDASFDAAITLNTIMFWTDFEAGMRELARVLAPGGRLVLGIPDPEHLRAAGFATRGYRLVVPERLGEQLPDYGFALVEIRHSGDGTALVVATRVDDEAPDGL